VALLGGCGAIIPPQPQNLVSAGAILNSTLCGLVAAHKNAPAGALFNNQQANVQLELKIVNSGGGGINVGAGGGGAGGAGGSGSSSGGSKGTAKTGSTQTGGTSASTGVLSYSGFSLAPSLSLGASSGWTVDTTTSLVINMPSSPDGYKPDVAQFCSGKLAGEDGDRFGMVRYLADTLPGLADLSDLSLLKSDKSDKINPPPISLQYNANFGVNYNASGQVTIIPVALPIPITPNASYTKNDVQNLTISVGAKPKVQPQDPNSLTKALTKALTAGSSPTINLQSVKFVLE
jgi:hypothetical protein